MRLFTTWASFVGVITVMAAAGLISVGPASADTLEITCMGGSPFNGTPIPSTDGDVKLVGDALRSCTLFPDEYVAGNVIVTGNVRVGVLGTIYGNVEANTDHGLTTPIPFGTPNAVLISGGVVTGNIIQEGNGDLRIAFNAWVYGNIEITGTGRLLVGAGEGARFEDSVITVMGNVINKGRGCTSVFTFNRGTVDIAGSVESNGGGGGLVSPAPVGFPERSGCAGDPDPDPDPVPDGGPITIGGDTCGIVDIDGQNAVDPLDTGDVTVKGDIEASC